MNDRTPKYKLLITEWNPKTGRYFTNTQAWRGRATDNLLSAYITAYIASLGVGGCNEHISKSLGYVPVPTKARIVTNDRQGYLYAAWNAPAFLAL